MAKGRDMDRQLESLLRLYYLDPQDTIAHQIARLVGRTHGIDYSMLPKAEDFSSKMKFYAKKNLVWQQEKDKIAQEILNKTTEAATQALEDLSKFLEESSLTKIVNLDKYTLALHKGEPKQIIRHSAPRYYQSLLNQEATTNAVFKFSIFFEEGRPEIDDPGTLVIRVFLGEYHFKERQKTILKNKTIKSHTDFKDINKLMDFLAEELSIYEKV